MQAMEAIDGSSYYLGIRVAYLAPNASPKTKLSREENIAEIDGF
jgi:hypothetical protein